MLLASDVGEHLTHTPELQVQIEEVYQWFSCLKSSHYNFSNRVRKVPLQRPLDKLTEPARSRVTKTAKGFIHEHPQLTCLHRIFFERMKMPSRFRCPWTLSKLLPIGVESHLLCS